MPPHIPLSLKPYWSSEDVSSHEGQERRVKEEEGTWEGEMNGKEMLNVPSLTVQYGQDYPRIPLL